jgi:two-component system sensor histidine kinase/response regulator
VEQVEDEGGPVSLPDLHRILDAGRQLLALVNGDEIERATPPTDSLGETPFSESGSDSLSAMVLVVDDTDANREMLKRRLEREGHRVATAVNGVEAMSAVRSQPFDLVLLDIMMPEMDGYTVLSQMKADEELRPIPVIMITALDDEESVVRCIKMGAEDYLPKPFNATLLKARMSACLLKKRAHDREKTLLLQLQQNLARLQVLETLRDDLTDMVVHDLRTPLTSVISGMQTLDVVGDLNDDQREMMEIAIDGGGTLLGMINDLLDVSHMESGSMPLRYTELDAGKLVAVAAGQVSSLCKSKGLAVIQDVAAHLPKFFGDEDKLRRALVNLLGNAIKFTPSGGTIAIAAAETEDHRSLIFSVTDTGEGIPAAEFSRIFEKFGQVESRQAGRTMSTGLGLTFCKLTALAHGGDISVESVLGAGSTFSFTVPLATQPTLAGIGTNVSMA